MKGELMTTIAVRRLESKGDGKPRGVVFACDDQTTSGHMRIGSSVKVFKKGPVTFGFAGHVRDKNLLQHALKVPKFESVDERNPEKWVITKLVPAIRKTFEHHGSLETDKGYSMSDSQLIIAVNGLCGYLDPDFSLSGEDEDMWAVGSGSQFALGAMTVGASPAEAVTVAGLHDVFTGELEKEVRVKW